MKNPTLSVSVLLFLLAAIVCQHQSQASDGGNQERLDMSLLMAVYEGSLENVRLFADNGASINARDYRGLTALMYSLYGENDDIIAYLIENRASLNSIDYSGNSVLMHALMAGRETFVIAHLSGFRLINSANDDGHTALILAVQSYDVEMVEILYLKGANIHHAANDGTTALMHAAAFGNFFNVDFLAFKGSSVIHQASDGTTALHLAAWYGHNEIAGLLLDWGADLESTDQNENTPLMSAIYGSQLETVWYLIESGASLSVANDKGFTPLSLASSLEDTQITELILQYDFIEPQMTHKKSTPLAYAYKTRNVRLQKRLVELGIQPRGLYFSELGVYQGLDFNGDDLMYHAGISLFESRFKVLIRLNYLARLQAVKLWVPRQNNSYYQFHESRSLLTLGVYRELLLGGKPGGLKVGLRPGIEGAWSMASYRGTSLEAPAGFQVVPVADIFFHHKKFSFFTGYGFYNTKQNDVSVHRIRLGIEYRFSFLKRPDTRYVPILN